MGKRTDRRVESEADPVVVPVHVTTKVSGNRIQRVPFEDGTDGFRVWITPAPERGKANQTVLGLLAREMGAPKSSRSIVRGTTTRNKLVPDYPAVPARVRSRSGRGGVRTAT